MSPKTIAFIGIGNMGWPMAANLVGAGFDVHVVDPTPGLTDRFVAEVGGTASTLDQAAPVADAMITILPDSGVVRAVLETAKPLLRPGTIVVEMSSGVPGVTRELAAELATGGVDLVDCPVSGGVVRSRAGTLTIMAGGSDDQLDAIAPILAAVGSSVHRCGPVGSGQAMKALNNLVSATGLLITCEALTIGQQFGLDPEVMTDILNASTGMNNSTKSKIKQHVLSRTFGSGFGIALMAKDLGIALEIAEDTDTPAPLTVAAVELWAGAARQLGPGEDHTAIAKVVEQQADTILGNPA